MTTDRNIAWVAGIIEGEGSIGLSYKSPVTKVGMTDKDVIDKLAIIIKCPVYTSLRKGYKTIYSICITGKQAVEWLYTLYSYFSKRRKSRTIEVINIWKVTWSGEGTHCKSGHDRSLYTKTNNSTGTKFCSECKRLQNNESYKRTSLSK